MTFKPTTEQQEIVKASQTNKMLKVNACAGSGKTSTLTFVANANPIDSLYLAFNKAMADEAQTKFPDHVTCKTTHSIAFRKTGVKIKHKLNRPKGKYINVAGTPAEIVKYYKIADLETESGEVQAKAIASLITKTVAKFEASAEREISSEHIPFKDIFERVERTVGKKEDFPEAFESVKSQLIEKVERYAQIHWKNKIDPHNAVLAGHDTYLKMFQLSNPKLNYEIIYLDEAQDTTDCVLDILLNQDCKLILVGDSRQAIYQWRGAINAMAKIECPERNITQSFRYGQNVADIATAIIGGEMEIQGNSSIDSKIQEIDENEPYAMLFRTNGALLMTAVMLIQEGKRVAVEANTWDFTKLLDSSEALYTEDQKNVKHEKVTPFNDWDDFIETAEDDPELKRVAKIVESGQKGMYIKFLSQVEKNSDDADVILTTAHKSKGRQFPQLKICDDFTKLYDEDTGERNTISEEELNLLYVAATRAVNVLDPNSTINDIYAEYMIENQ